MTAQQRKEFDIIVIGSGPGGQKAALTAAKAGEKVALVERYSMLGGGCVHFGTLPSKSLRESIYRWSLGSNGTLGQETSNPYSATVPLELPSIERLFRRKDRVIENESQVIHDQLGRNNIRVIQGTAEILGPHEVRVAKDQSDRMTICGEFILVATGASPVAPQNFKVDGKFVHDSDTILCLKKTPRSLAVIGAGIIGCEYASMFATAGTHVYLVDKRHEILASVDAEITEQLIQRFRFHGMEILLETEIEKLEVTEEGDQKRVHLILNGGRELETELAVIAMGRQGNTKGLGLEKVGVEVSDRGIVKVDKSYRTDVPSIFAVGDVVGQPALASTSMEQGRIAICNAFGLNSYTMPENFPYGIYTIPEISMVGKTEEQLKEEKIEHVVGRGKYKEVARGQIVGDHWGLLKLLVDKKTGKLLGVHVIGDSAAEIIHIGQAVLNFGGSIQYFIENVFNYPTFAEAYKTAAFDALNKMD